ncbi:MAG: hypothetical protein WCQ32_03150 [bacterium]
MAKRSTTLGKKEKSKHSHKTQKRLDIKYDMIAKKLATVKGSRKSK